MSPSVTWICSGADAEHAGGELRQHGSCSLSLRGRAGRDEDLSRWSDADRGAFERAAPGSLDVVAEADAEPAALLARRLAAGREVRPTGRRQRAALAFGIIAAVVGHRQAVAGRDRRDIGHLLRRDEIAAADLVAAEAKLVGDAIEQPLHHERALRAPGAARRGRRHQIGEAERDLEPIGRQDIWADEIGGRILRQRKSGRRGGAVVVAEMAADREQLALAVDRRFHLPILLALVIGGGETFAAILDPFDRAAQQRARPPGSPAPPDRTGSWVRSRRRRRARSPGPAVPTAPALRPRPAWSCAASACCPRP